jgi:hypothetical protein
MTRSKHIPAWVFNFKPHSLWCTSAVNVAGASVHHPRNFGGIRSGPSCYPPWDFFMFNMFNALEICLEFAQKKLCWIHLESINVNVPADWIHLATLSALLVPINVTRHQGPNILSRRFGELCAGLLTGRSMEPGNGRCVKQCHFCKEG